MNVQRKMARIRNILLLYRQNGDELLKENSHMPDSGQYFFIVDERHVENEACQNEEQRVHVLDLRIGGDRPDHQVHGHDHDEDRDN